MVAHMCEARWQNTPIVALGHLLHFTASQPACCNPCHASQLTDRSNPHVPYTHAKADAGHQCQPAPCHLHQLEVPCPHWHAGHALRDALVEVKPCSNAA